MNINQETKSLIESFYGNSIETYEDWNVLMGVGRIIYGLCSFGESIGVHERKVLNDLRDAIDKSIRSYSQTKVLSCIIDFINVYNIIKPR